MNNDKWWPNSPPPSPQANHVAYWYRLNEICQDRPEAETR